MTAPDVAPFAWASMGEAARFLAALDPTADGFHFRTFSEPNKGSGAKYAGPLSEVFDKLERANAAGHGVFVVANSGGQDAASITRVRAVFADLDDAPLDPVLACALPPSLVVQTSPNRFHAYWLLADTLPLDDFKPVQKAIAARFGGDPVVCDLPRVMRCPGFHNRKGEPYPVAMRDDLGSGQRYSADSIRREFPPNVHHLPLSAGTATAGTPPAVAGAAPVTGAHATLPDSFDAAANAPGLDVAAVRDALRHLDAANSEIWRMVACSLRAYPEGWELLDEWSRTAPAHYSEGRNKAAWSKATPYDGGAAVLFAAAMKAGWSNTAVAPAIAVPAAKPSGFTFTRSDQLVSKPQAWLIDGWLPAGSLAGLIGASGSGKTFVALSMACSIATGHPFFGADVSDPGSVFMLAGEGKDGIRRRLRGWEIEQKTSLDNKALFIGDYLPALTDPANVQMIVAAIRAMVDEYGTPKLCIVDTLHIAMAGADENSAASAGLLFAQLRQICVEFPGVTVLLVHHSGHSEARARGTSAFYAGFDAEFYLQRDSNGRIALKATKCKDWEAPEEMLFDLVPVEGTESVALRLPHDATDAINEMAINNLILEPAAVGNGYKLTEREAAATLNAMGINISRQAIGKRRRKYETG